MEPLLNKGVLSLVKKPVPPKRSSILTDFRKISLREEGMRDKLSHLVYLIFLFLKFI